MAIGVIVAADAAAIAAVFDLGDVLGVTGPCARGELGQVWRLSTATGEWAVKESFDAAGADEHAATTRFYEAAIRRGVPAPKVRRTIDRSHQALIGATTVRVVGWVDLDEPDPSLDASIVGATVAALHRVDFAENLGAHWWYTDPVGPAAWDTLIDELRVVRSPLAERFAFWRDEFVALEGWLAPGRAAQTCHRDLWADNLRRTTAGAPCVIDWDNAGEADPNQELAMVLFEFASDDPRRAPALIESYVEAGGPGRVSSRADFSMTIATLGHLAHRIGTLWLAPDTTPAEQRRLEGRFDETDDRPFTRAVIDTLLDAIQ